MTSWWQKELQRVAEQGAVALGLMSEEEAKPDDQLTASELSRRFMTEAVAIKDPRRQIGSLLIPSCSNVQIEDGRGRCGPQCTIEDIGLTMQSWQGRLDSKDTPDALDALLQSRALDVVLKALPNSKAGRLALQDAADCTAQSALASPLRVVLCHTAAVPDAFLGQILLLFSDAAKLAEQCRQTGKDASLAERGLHWASAILSAALCDAGEAALKKFGHVVELVQYAVVEVDKSASGQAPVMTCEQKLDMTLKLSNSFGELKRVCDQLKDATQHPSGSDVSKLLLALSDSLKGIRKDNEGLGIESIEPATVQAVFVQAAVSSCEVEATLEQRRKKASDVGRVLDALPEHQEDVAAVCLAVERLRGHRLQDALDDLQRDLWGPEAFEHDEERLAELRATAGRAENLVTEAWRERMHYAAETLDDTASNTALHYKEMRQTLQKSIARLVVLEKSKAGKGEKGSSAQASAHAFASRSKFSVDEADLARVASLRTVLGLKSASEQSSSAAPLSPDTSAAAKPVIEEPAPAFVEELASPAAVKLHTAAPSAAQESPEAFRAATAEEAASPAMKLSAMDAAMQVAKAAASSPEEPPSQSLESNAAGSAMDDAMQVAKAAASSPEDPLSQSLESNAAGSALEAAVQVEKAAAPSPEEPLSQSLDSNPGNNEIVPDIEFRLLPSVGTWYMPKPS